MNENPSPENQGGKVLPAGSPFMQRALAILNAMLPAFLQIGGAYLQAQDNRKKQAAGEALAAIGTAYGDQTRDR